MAVCCRGKCDGSSSWKVLPLCIECLCSSVATALLHCVAVLPANAVSLHGTYLCMWHTVMGLLQPC